MDYFNEIVCCGFRFRVRLLWRVICGLLQGSVLRPLLFIKGGLRIYDFDFKNFTFYLVCS